MGNRGPTTGAVPVILLAVVWLLLSLVLGVIVGKAIRRADLMEGTAD